MVVQFCQYLNGMLSLSLGRSMLTEFKDKLLPNLRGDLSGALSAAIITLPMSIGYGIIAFAPLGARFAPGRSCWVSIPLFFAASWRAPSAARRFKSAVPKPL
jgi:ABC-type dipeptide/oligopeptide/nickel transport system permease component